MSEKHFCYIADESRVQVVCEITKGFDTEEYTVLLLDDEGKQSRGTSETRTIAANKTFPIDSLLEITHPPSDLIQLTNVHGPAILNTLRSRFQQDSIYTSIGPILIACNPFRWIKGVYEKEIIMAYFNGERNQSEHPHVFAMAHDSLMGLQFGKNQSLIISGESGAGKTEATKQCLNYIAEVAGSSSGVHHRILQANPILEGWGNAKTLRNNNSSRFGKFIELLISASSGEIVGSSNTTYLLEKSRVVFQEAGERNYHVFYQLLFGAPNELIHDFHLDYLKANPEEVMCINQSGCMFIEGVDEQKDYEEINDAQRDIGFDTGDYRTLLQAVAGIIHLRNIEFVEDSEDSEGAMITSHPQDFITKAGQLFGLELENFTRSLLYKSVRGGGRRTSVSYKKYTPDVAIENRNALAKEIYRRCFDYIVAKINSSINAKPEELAKIRTSMIGILDIFGFEIFKKNSFEQLCINLANEALQKHFNTNIFEMEMSIYTAEDIIIPDLSYKDNEDVLSLVIQKPKGLIPLLDEEGQVPRGSWEGFLRKFTTHHAKSPRLKFRQGLQIFTIVHYAGDVAYDPSLFIIKNKDTLSADLSEAMHLSSVPLIQELFPESSAMVPQDGGRRSSSAAGKQTVGTNFRVQLDNLIANLNTTSPKYIRCVKPNAEKKPHLFDSALTNEQLTYSGVFEAVLIMQNGFPFRLGLWAFKERYHMLVDYKMCCEAFSGDNDDRDKLMTFVELLKEVDEEFCLCHVGKTMVFYRVAQHRLLEKMRNNIMNKARAVLHKKGRGFVARNFYQHIITERKRCAELILARKAVDMRESADILTDLKNRVNTTYSPHANIRLDPCAVVAYDYSAAIDLEERVNAELKDLMDPKHDVFEVFDQLQQCIERAKGLEFTLTFQTEVLSIEWQKNEVISLAIQQVAKYENIIAIKKNLELNLASSNDVELEVWLGKLESARQSGDVDSNFCATEAANGTKIVQAAQKEFDDLVNDVDDAILKGKFTYKLDSCDQKDSFESFIHFKCEVDASLLTAFLLKFDQKYSKTKQSVKLMRLVNLCRQLACLRQAAKLRQWAEVERLLPAWKLYVMDFSGTGDDNNSSCCSSSRMSVNNSNDEELLAVVPEFHKSIGKEIRDLYDCSVSCLQFPAIIQELNQVKIPDTFQLQMSSVQISSRVEELIAALTSADELAFMSEEHQLAVCNITERIHIRRLIACQLHEDLRLYLAPSTPRTLPAGDGDSLTAQKWLNFFDICGEVWQSLLAGVPSGAPGSMNFAAFSPTRLRKVLKVCNSLEVEPAQQWQEIQDRSGTLLKIWTCLQNKQLSEALLLVQAVVGDIGLEDATEKGDKLEKKERESGTGIIKTFYADLIALVQKECRVYHREIVSQLALHELAEHIVSGAVTGEVGDLNIDSVSTEALESCLTTIQPKLIMTEEVTQLLTDCDELIRLRQAVKASEWDELLDDTAQLFEQSNGFQLTHPSLLSEFETIYGEAQDLQVRKRIADILLVPVLSVSPTGEVLGERCLAESIVKLNSAINFGLSRKSLSSEAHLLLNSAILISTARQALSQSRWEDIAFGLQGVETSKLSLEHFADYSEADRLKLLAVLMKPQKIVYLEELELAEATDGDGDGAVSIPNKCINELLGHARSIELHEFATEEIGILRRGAIERRCRLILILALSTNQICGVVEKIDTTTVSIEHLLAGVEFVKLSVSQLSHSLHRWIEGALYILNFRIAVGGAELVVLSSLCTYFSDEYLQKCQDFLTLHSPLVASKDKVLVGGESEKQGSSGVAAAGFPVAELQLVVDYINDCLNINSLVEAMNLGRVQFYENKFDTKMVSFSHLLSAIDVTKKHAPRSDRLDRLMFYAELCVFLRQALLSDNWETSTTGKSKRGASVRQCLIDYDEANGFFKVPMENIPPPFLKDEFHITKRELERQTILFGFSSAFQSGRIGGVNGTLQLHDIMYQRLTDQVDKSRVWAEASGIKDFDLNLYVNAAQELIQVRKRALEVHNKYKSDIMFPKPTNSLRTVIQSGFLSDAINHAVTRVDGLTKHPYAFNTEWTKVEQALSKMKISSRLRSTRQQVELLAAETFQRSFCGNILHVLHGLPKKSSGRLSTRQSLNASTFLQGWCRSYAIHRQEMDKQSNSSIKPDPTTELLYKSSVALTHLLRAEGNNRYDPFERTWLTGDKNPASGVFSKYLPPTFHALSSNIDQTDHSVQNILRAVTKWLKLHPAATDQIRRAVRHVEDEVTVAELSCALVEGHVTGTVGNIQYSAISLIPIRTALERALDISSPDGVAVVTKTRLQLDRNGNGRFRFMTRYSANEVAHIDQQVGFQKLQGQSFHMKIVYKPATGDSIATALKRAQSETIQRSDVIKLRHTCELIYELREALKTKDYSMAYNIICDNIGEDHQTFKVLIDHIYAGDFSLHFLGVEEFSLIAFEVFENYFRLKASHVLMSNPIAGSRTMLNLFAIHDLTYRGSMLEVLSMIEGLVEVSGSAIQLRELCFLINHMRELAIEGSVCMEQELKIARKRDMVVPEFHTGDLQTIMKNSFLKDAMNNAFAAVKVITWDSKKLNALEYKRLIAMLAIANKVETALLQSGADILSKQHQNALLAECHLVKEYSQWHTAVLSLQRVLHIEMCWYSFSTGCLKSDSIMLALLESAVSEAKALKINENSSHMPVEQLILEFLNVAIKFQTVLEVTKSSIIEIEGNDVSCDRSDTTFNPSSKMDVGSDGFNNLVKPAMMALLTAAQTYTSSKAHLLLMLPPNFLKQVEEIRKVVADNNNYLLLLDSISDPTHFVIGRIEMGSEPEATVMAPLLLRDYPDPKPNDTRNGLKNVEMFSLKGTRLKNMVLLQLQLRSAVLMEQFGKAEELCQNLAVVNVLHLENKEFALIQELCSTLMMTRQLEQGIISCLLPPVAGWSNFTSAPSLALSIVDFPLRQAIQVLRAKHAFPKVAQTTMDFDSEADSDDGYSDHDEEEEELNPVLNELGSIGSMMLSVIGAVRRQVWMKLDVRGDDDAFDALRVSKDKFIELFPKDQFTNVKEATKKLDEVFDDVFLCAESQQSVSDTLTALQTHITTIQFMSTALREFVDYFISSVQIEQEIFELSNNALAAIAGQKISGMPGCVQCTDESVQTLDAAYTQIVNSSQSIESSPGLKRIAQSLRLLKLARLAISDDDWSSLGPLLDLYVYMRSLEKYDSEKNCADLMYYEIVDNKTLLNLSHDEFERIITDSTDKFKANVDSNKVNELEGIVNDPPSQEVKDHAQVLLGVDDYHDLLQSIPDLETEMKLLNNHYYFEKAGHFFNLALSTTPADGTPGDLNTSNIQFDLFHEVSEILSDHGLLSYPSGMHLHLCSLAMVELRMGQCSQRLGDIKSSLVKLNAMRDEEASGSGVRYLVKAFAELDLARVDLEQQELSQVLYNGLLENRLPSGSTRFDLKSGKAYVDRLAVILRDCASNRRKIISKRCGVLFKSIQLLLSLWEHLHTKAWDDLQEVISAYDSDLYDEIMTAEVECAQRLMNVSGALNAAEEGIHNGRISGSVDIINLSEVSTVKLEEAKQAFSLVKSEWRTAIISSYDTSCTVLISIRDCAIKRQWAKVVDLCILALTKHSQQFPLLDSVHEEVVLAKEYATFVVIEGTLVDALMNGRMDGDVGEIQSTSVSTQFVTDALEYVATFDASAMSHPRLTILKDTVEVVRDLRKAQLLDTWMLDPSSSGRSDKRLLPDPDTMAVTMSLVPMNWLASAGGNIMKNIGMTGLSGLMKKYLGSSKHLKEALAHSSLDIQMEIGQAGWLLQCNAIDDDGWQIDTEADVDAEASIKSKEITSEMSVEHTDKEEMGEIGDIAVTKSETDTVVPTVAAVRVTVEDVLSRAQQLEFASGLAPEAQPELAFAREEINHRHIVQMLLGAMTSQGFVGQAGKLDGSSMDLHPLERAIFFAENDMDNSNRGKCKWMLRDAKLLFKARKFRVEKRWHELNDVLLEVSGTKITQNSSTEVDEEGNVVTRRPMLPFAWKEIALIQADMHFYTCLSEFAQEMTSRAGKTQIRSRRKGLEGKSLTGLLRVLLRTLSAAELHPSMEFDRLLEAENVALELRTHMTFDSLVSPREVILKVLNIRERDKRNHVPSYVCLLMPDISRLSDVLDTEQLVESLEISITKGQNYLRAALGFIDGNDIDLEGMRASIHTAMPLLNLTGSKEHLNLLSVATALLAIRVEVVALNWDRVAELLEKHESLLLTHEAILSEEISRLNIEIENDIACRDIEQSLLLGRCKDVYELVNKLSTSTQRRSSVTLTRSGSMTMRTNRPKERASVSLNPNQVSAIFATESLPELDKSIEDAMQVRNRSITTTTMLRAAVLIRSLRAAIQSGNWEEVQAILDEESSYLRFPQICQDEIKEVKAAMSYRTCMTVLSKGLLNGATMGMPGELNISNVDCIPLEEAMKQTKTLEIFDPATTMLLEIGSYVCDLRHAVLAGRWFQHNDGFNVMDVEEGEGSEKGGVAANRNEEEMGMKKVQFLDESMGDDLENSGVVQNRAPFGSAGPASSESALNMDMGVINEDEEEENSEEEDEEEDVFSNEEGESDEEAVYVNADEEGSVQTAGTSASSDIEFGPDCSVEELLTVMAKRVKTTQDLKRILGERTVKSNSASEVGGGDTASRVPEWIEVQLKAIESVNKELTLLQVDLNERRRVDILVSILEVVPQPTRDFNRIENAPSVINKNTTRGSAFDDHYDMYHIKSLQAAISQAQAIPGEMMKETTRIFNTAELILSFRKTMKSMEIENFKELLTKAKDYSNQGKLSLHYGLYELNSYRSATMTVTLTKAELLKSLESGRVSGPLHKLNIDEIETEALDFWVTSCAELMGMSQELMVGLLDAYQEAKVMLDLRRSVVEDKWDEVVDKLDKYFDHLYKFEFGSEELKHIQYASKYRIVECSIAEILDDKIPTDCSNLPAYILPKMEPLEKALIYGQRIIEYQAQHLHRNIDIIPTKRNVADSYEFERICQNAENVFKLWKSILSKSWQEEIIASGQVHLLPRPSDPLLNVYFESVRQHEVSQRLGMVHEQLAVLQLTGEKAVHNLRNSVRMSISVMNARDLLGGEVKETSLDSSTFSPPPAPSLPSTNKKSSVRSSLSLQGTQPVQTFAEKQRNKEQNSRAPPPQPSFDAPPKPPQNETIQEMLKARRTSTQRRKSSIGGMISTLMGTEMKPKIAKKKKSQHRNLSVVLDRQQSFQDVPSVAMVICELDWSTLSIQAKAHFENARNLLINKVTLLRVKWGCKEGCARELSDGNVSLADLSVELLEVALADCRRISFYSQQSTSQFKFSEEVETLLQLANILFNIRTIIMANRIEELLSHLRLFDDLSDRHEMNLTLSRFPEIEKELRLIEKFSHEYVAEKVLNNALAYLASLPQVDSKTAGHSTISEVNNLEKKNRSIGEMTLNYRNTVQIAKKVRQALISAVMCNQHALRELEGSIFRLVGAPGSSFANSKTTISRIFAVLRKCASIRFVSSGKGMNTSEQSVVSRRMSVQAPTPSSASYSDISYPTFEKSFSNMHGALDNINTGKEEYFDEIKSDAENTLRINDSVGPNDKLARMKALPYLLCGLTQRAQQFVSQPSDVYFPSAMFLVPKAEVEAIEDVFSDIEFLYANIWLPANEGLLFDPLWLLAGQSILADIRSANKVLSLSTSSVPSSENDDRGAGVGGGVGVKALAGFILRNHELLHHASFDFLLAAKRRNDKTSKRVNPVAGLDINLSDLSTLIKTLDGSVKSAQEQLTLAQKQSMNKKPISLYGRHKKNHFMTLSRPSDTFDLIILDFQERVTMCPPRPRADREIVDVRFDQERYKKRLFNTCLKLLQLQGADSPASADTRQREVRHAVSKRRRQFVQTL